MLIGNGMLLTFGDDHKLINDGAVLIEGNTIIELGETGTLKSRYPNEEFLDARGKLIMPGMICAHGHFYGMFSRGMGLKDEAPENFMQILERLWWRLDLALGEEENYLSAMVCLINAIKSGTTCIIDHHASPTRIAGSLDTVAKATLNAGVRACLSYEVTDRNGIPGAEEGIAENMRFIRRCESEKNDLLAASFGLHASVTLSSETLKKCVEALGEHDAGFHVHIAEDKADQADSLAKYGKRTVFRLRDEGILGPLTIGVHCIHIDEDEMEVLKDTGTNVVHNPESNMNNAVGVANVLTMLEKGIPVALGTDGMTLDMFKESSVNYLLHKLANKDPRVMGGETVQMLFDNNSKLANKFFPKPLGELSPGAFADIILVDYKPPTPMNTGNFPWHMQFGMSGADVDTTIVGGKVIMKGRKLLTIDEEEITRRSRELAPAVWERF